MKVKLFRGWQQSCLDKLSNARLSLCFSPNESILCARRMVWFSDMGKVRTVYSAIKTFTPSTFPSLPLGLRDSLGEGGCMGCRIHTQETEVLTISSSNDCLVVTSALSLLSLPALFPIIKMRLPSPTQASWATQSSCAHIHTTPLTPPPHACATEPQRTWGLKHPCCHTVFQAISL